MSLGSVIVVWLILLAMLAAEFLFARLPNVLPFIGLGMAALVALTFMRLSSSRGLPTVFALTGLFWLAVLMGMASLDSFTRHDIPVAASTPDQGR